MTPAEAIEAAELAEAEIRYRNQLAREMYQLGRRQAEAEQAEAWRQFAAPVARGIPFAELEERRWGPGGRAHFADPRPGDYPGRRNGGSQMNQPDRALPAPKLAPGAELADPGADQLPQILAMAAEAEPELGA